MSHSYKQTVIDVYALGCITVTTSAEVGPSPCSGGVRAVEVTDLLAIADPLFIFLWFCLVLYHTWFQSHSLHVVYLTLCSPSLSLSVIVLFVSIVQGLFWCATGFAPT